MGAAPLSARLARSAVLLVLASLVGGASAWAHTRSVSYSMWTLDEHGADVRLSLSRLDLTRLPHGWVRAATVDPQLARYLASHLELLAGGRPCPARELPRLEPSTPGRVVFAWRVDCPLQGARAIRSRLFREVVVTHLHFARIRGPGGKVLERLLTPAEPVWGLAPKRPGGSLKPRGSSLLAYLRLGIEHIGTGPDHMAFVLALILIAARLGEVAKVVTGFTLAHSLTLAAAALGWARPEAQTVGALVGLSIALVAAENGYLVGGRPRAVPALATGGLALLAFLALLGHGAIPARTLLGLAFFTACYFGLLRGAERPETLRIAIAFAFGLVHGFGFGGFLVAMELPRERILPALFGFNAGVELGQLALVAALWPPLHDLARLGGGRAHRLLVEAGSAALCGLGLFWFLTRAFG